MRVKWINESQQSPYLENKARDRSQEAGPSAWGSGDAGDVRVIGEVVDKTWAQEEGGSCSAGVTGRGVHSGTTRERRLRREGDWDS